MADLVVTPGLVAPTGSTIPAQGIAGATILAGQPLYADITQALTLKPALATAASTAQVVGIAMDNAAINQPIRYAIGGIIFIGGGILIKGQVYVLSGLIAGNIAPDNDFDYAEIGLSVLNPIVLSASGNGAGVNISTLNAAARTKRVALNVGVITGTSIAVTIKDSPDNVTYTATSAVFTTVTVSNTYQELSFQTVKPWVRADYVIVGSVFPTAVNIFSDKLDGLFTTILGIALDSNYLSLSILAPGVTG